MGRGSFRSLRGRPGRNSWLKDAEKVSGLSHSPSKYPGFGNLQNMMKGEFRVLTIFSPLNHAVWRYQTSQVLDLDHVKSL